MSQDKENAPNFTDSNEDEESETSSSSNPSSGKTEVSTVDLVVSEISQNVTDEESNSPMFATGDGTRRGDEDNNVSELKHGYDLDKRFELISHVKECVNLSEKIEKTFLGEDFLPTMRILREFFEQQEVSILLYQTSISPSTSRPLEFPKIRFDASQLGSVYHEPKIPGTPTKRRYRSSGEKSELMPDSKRQITSPLQIRARSDQELAEYLMILDSCRTHLPDSRTLGKVQTQFIRNAAEERRKSHELPARRSNLYLPDLPDAENPFKSKSSSEETHASSQSIDQKSRMAVPPKKRPYHSSDKTSEYQPDSKKRATSVEEREKTKHYKDTSYSEPYHSFLPGDCTKDKPEKVCDRTAVTDVRPQSQSESVRKNPFLNSILSIPKKDSEKFSLGLFGDDSENVKKNPLLNTMLDNPKCKSDNLSFDFSETVSNSEKPPVIPRRGRRTTTRDRRNSGRGHQNNSNISRNNVRISRNENATGSEIRRLVDEMDILNYSNRAEMMFANRSNLESLRNELERKILSIEPGSLGLSDQAYRPRNTQRSCTSRDQATPNTSRNQGTPNTSKNQGTPSTRRDQGINNIILSDSSYRVTIVSEFMEILTDLRIAMDEILDDIKHELESGSYSISHNFWIFYDQIDERYKEVRSKYREHCSDFEIYEVVCDTMEAKFNLLMPIFCSFINTAANLFACIETPEE